ncbi:MAG: tyrosine-type recombinase/integrase, partial [Pyrinomonadaceae bacterium]
EHNAAIAQGQNPANKRRIAREEMTLQELFDDYMERHGKPNKRFWRQDQSKFNQYLTCNDRGGFNLSDRRLSKILKADFAQLHSLISKKHHVTANRVLALISSIFSWAIRAGLWEYANPAAGIAKNREKSRDRFLQADELPQFFQALVAEENETLRDYVLISLLTGARESNVLAMQWDQLNLDAGTWYIPETKNGTPQLIPLTPHSVSILRSRKEKASLFTKFVFEGSGKTGHLTVPKRGWYRILKRAAVSNLRIHDLRRTLGSWQAATGASLPIIGKTLNHKHPSSTAIYARLTLDPVRDALMTAHAAMLRVGGEDLTALLTHQPANI